MSVTINCIWCDAPNEIETMVNSLVCEKCGQSTSFTYFGKTITAENDADAMEVVREIDRRKQWLKESNERMQALFDKARNQ